MKKAVLVIARRGFQDVELAGTRDELVAAGFDVTLASTAAGPCTGKFGSTEQATVAIADTHPQDYDRLAYIGGPGAAELADSEDAKDLAWAFVDAKKPVGAICIAPTILAKAGILHGLPATVWDDGQGTQAALLRESGARYTGEPVTITGRIVTANGPDAAHAFGKAFASL